MRLLAFTDSLDGGREQREFFGQLRRLANRDDVSCAVVAAEGGRYRKEIEALGFPVHVTSGYGGVTSAEYEGKMRELAGVARQAGCNLVLANGFGSFRAVDLACRLGVPSVWAIHEGLDVPDWGTADHRIALHRSYARERLELALREASSVVLSGEATRALYERYGNPTSLVTLPRGVDLSDVPAPQDSREALDERRRRDLPASATVVLCVAPIQPHEGHGFLAQAFAEVSDAHPEAILVMVGDHGTPYVAGLRQYLERSCLSARTRVEPPASQPYEWHGIADALVFAAETPPSPIAMLEEMTFASPVIAARAPSVADLIEDGRTGYLYDQSDVKDLARTLDRVVGAGPEGRAAVGHAAARRVRERHDPDAYAESLWRLLDALLEDPKASAAQALSHAERGRARTQRSVFGKVSVMIPTLDAGPQFERSLESIAAQEGLDELEVVVIDSGSSDETVSLARSSGARVQEIPAAEFNHGRVRNQLAESATGDVLFTTVQDATLVGKYAVRNLVLALQSDVRLAAVSARQIAGADADLYSGYQAWLRNETMALRGNAPRGSLAWSGFLVDDVCAAIPRSAWKALRFRELSYAEDIDFGMRAHDAGWRTCFADDAAVWHHHDRDAAHLLSRSAVHRRTMAALLNDLKRIPEAQPGLDALAAEMPAALGQLEAAISQATGDRESISLARCVGAVAERLAQDPPPLVPTGELAGMFALFDDHAPWDVALRAARDEAVRAGLRKWILLVLEYPWVRQYALAHSAPVARDAARAFVARCAASNLGEVVGDAMRDAPEAAVTRQVTGGAWIGSGSWST
jgi:glycosyltransferase involved in cell wall biosynthesis/GT2 family glycosyltransferase